MDDKKKKWLLFAALAAVVVGLIVVMVFSVFVPSREPVGASGSVVSVIPEGEAERLEDSKSKVYRGSTEDYYEMLASLDPATEDVSLVSSSPAMDSSEPVAASTASARPEAAAERVFGPAPSSPTPSTQRSSGGGGHSPSRPMTSEERLEFDRKRAEMVRDVLSGGSSVSEDSLVTEDAPEKPVSIDLSAVGTSDGIISTLDDEPSEGVSYGDGVLKPFKCMFVRDQKLVNGQRVTLRLLEDYTDGGVRIPANTHLQAICRIGDRLELQVRSLDLGGRIVPLSLEAYDTDGLQGIYCPETSASKNSRKASDDAIATAGQTFGGLVGDLANTVIRTGASIAKSATGEVSVSVVSGYEFYLVKIEKR